MHQRLTSLDAFRGFTIAAMILVNNPGSWQHVYPPLRHAEWHGMTPTDLVFPFFLFIVGTSMVFAFARQQALGVRRGPLTLRALRRGIVLFALGLLIAGLRRLSLPEQVTAIGLLAGAGLLALRLRGTARELALIAVWLGYGAFQLHAPAIRIPGVLQRIGLCFFLASVAWLWLPRRAVPWLIAVLLLGYWAVLVLVPVPGHGAGRIDDPAGNVASYVDRLLLAGHLWVPGVRDPEGPLHTFPALATTLLGALAGEQLVAGRPCALPLAWRGLLLAVLGLAWSFVLPLNKPLWTSSYAVLTAGLATGALAAAHWWIDGRGHRRLAAPFVTYGVNAITVFVGSAVLGRVLAAIPTGDGVALPRRLFTLLAGTGLPPPAASLAYALAWVGAWYLVLRAMQARGWIVKV